MADTQTSTGDSTGNVAISSETASADTARDDQAQSLFQLVEKLSKLPDLDLDAITGILGFSFTHIESNEYYDIYESDGAGIITSAEIRMSNSEPRKKLLILDIGFGSNIDRRMVENKYPDAETHPNFPDNPIKFSVGITEPWGKLSYGFKNNSVLTRIVLDSI